MNELTSKIENHKPLISLIVPVFNSELYLRECLESIVNQTYTNLEIILIDDGSSDNSAMICDEFQIKDDRVTALHKDNGGVSSARNAGIEIATGEWISFVDSDDIISEQYIETLVKLLHDGRSLPCVGHYTFSNNNIVKEKRKNIMPMEIYSFKKYVSVHGGFPFGALYSNQIIKEINLRFDTSMSYVEDVLWNSIYFYYIDKAIFKSDKIYFYRKHNSSATSKCSNKKWVVSSWFACRNISIDWYLRNNIDKKSLTRLQEHVRSCNNNIIAECIKGKLRFSDYNLIRYSSYKVKNEEKLLQYFGLEYLFEKYFTIIYFWLYKLLIKLF